MPVSRSDDQLANFVHNVVVLRRSHGLSKRAMAEILHVSLHSLEQMENGKLPPRLKAHAVLHLAAHFHIPAHELLRRRLSRP